MRIFRDHEVVRLIGQDPGRYMAYVGAGVSAESAVKTADDICDDILEQLTDGLGDEEAKHLEATLDWPNHATRYSRCIHRFGNDLQRVQYFRRLLEGKEPSFAHYAIALLATEGVLSRVIITTNFDKLIESAFVRLGALECQPIRTQAEQKYLGYEPDKTYVVKLHGDYDTYNIRNTPGELLYIEDSLEARVAGLTRGAGLLVLGSSGFEASIQRLFGTLVRAMSDDSPTLGFGLLWGVYMGPARNADTTEDDIRARVTSSVSPRMVETIEEASKHNETCGFFPIWGAGEFLRQLVERAASESVAARASLYLSHRMRLERVLNREGVTQEGIAKHQAALDGAKQRLADVGRPPETEHVASFEGVDGALRLDLLYGDISSPSLLGTADGISAVVSPEDTTISAGGGVALALLEGAGAQYMLNELAKHQPIGQDEVAVTSGGELPVHYVLHAAALKIRPDGGHIVSPGNVEATVRNALTRAYSLGIENLWLPLIAAGGAERVSPEESLAAIASAMRDHVGKAIRVNVVIYQDKVLDRRTAISLLTETLGPMLSASTT